MNAKKMLSPSQRKNVTLVRQVQVSKHRLLSSSSAEEAVSVWREVTMAARKTFSLGAHNLNDASGCPALPVNQNMVHCVPCEVLHRACARKGGKQNRPRVDKHSSLGLMMMVTTMVMMTTIFHVHSCSDGVKIRDTESSASR